MAGEMGLVVEPGHGRHLARRAAVEEEPARAVDTAGHQVLVRCDAVRPAERPYQMGGMGVHEPGGLVEGDAFGDVLVEEFAEVAGEDGAGCRGDGVESKTIIRRDND